MVNGNLIETKDRNGVTTYNKYDGLNRLVEMYNSKDGNKKKVTYVYDLNGTLKKDANANQAAEYTYDQYGRVTKIRYDNGSQKEYTYDNADRVTSLTVKQGSVTELVELYEYDAGGRRTAVVYNGMRTVYSYDDANQLKSETNGLTGITTKFGYTAFGALEWLRAYQSGEIVNDCEYKYDLTGNQIEKFENGDVTKYHYDALSRLKTALLPEDILQTYEFDDYGNIKIMMTYNGHFINETKYYYDNAGRLTLTSENSSQSRYKYDSCGNLIHREDVIFGFGFSHSTDTSYSYNGFNQLVRVNDVIGDMYEYAYDAEGMRIGKSTGDSKTGYLYENGYILIETDGQGLVTAKNIWGTRLIARETQDDTYSYLFDGHGNITALTDKLGSMLKDYAYDPYGNELLTAAHSAGEYIKQAEEDYNNPFRYCGEYFDEETGFYYLRARFYDPEIGRFISEDTYKGKATDTLSLNLYTYCQGDPVNATDPSGHMPKWLQKTLAVAAIVVVAAVAVVAVVATAGAAGAAIGMAAGMYLGASAATVATVTTVATVGAYGVATGIGACGVNRAVEAATGTNYGAKLMGEKAYNATEMALNIAGAGVVSTAAYAPSSTSNKSSQPTANKPVQTNYVVTPKGTAIPVPKGANGPTNVINEAGNTTGFAYTGGSGGANGQVSTVRIMDPRSAIGKAPAYPNGYVVYQNAATPKPQPVNPITGQTVSRAIGHYALD